MHACGHDTHMTDLGRHRAAAGGDAQPMVGHAGHDRPARRGDRRRRQGDARRRPVHPLPAPDPRHRLPRFGEPAGGHDRLFAVGPALANVDSVDILVHGVGGHGAYPHTTRDPIVLASRIVTTLQTLVSRELNPLDSAVVTVGSFHAGTKHNIISDEARLQLTVRSFTPEVRRQLLDGIRRIARGEAIAAGLPEDRLPTVTVRDAEFTPATVNTDGLTLSTEALFRAHFGDARVERSAPVMGGEDFSPLPPRRSAHREPDLLGRRRPPGALGRGPWRRHPAALAAQPVLGARGGTVIATATEAMTVAAMGVLGGASAPDRHLHVILT